MGTRASYPASVKEEAVQMKLAGVSTKEIMDKLGIKNKTQVKTWMKPTGFINLLESSIHTVKDLNTKMKTRD